MPSEASKVSTEAVLIPRALHGRLNQFVSSLHKKLLEAAVRRAVVRCPRQNDVLLVADDVLSVARAVLPASVTELEIALTGKKSSHVRRKAS